MSAEELLVLFRSTANGAIQAYFTDIPGSGLFSSLSVHGPIDLPDNDNLWHTGTPVYDYNKDQILWARTKDRDQSIWLWRLDPHFSLVSCQDLSINVKNHEIPSIVLDGKTVTLATGSSGNNKDTGFVIHRRGQDNKWTQLPFNSALTFGMKAVVYKPLVNVPLKYIYAFRFYDGLNMDVIRESSFNDLSRDDSIQWQNFKVAAGFSSDSNAWAPIVIHDKITRKNRLYLFAYINLRGTLVNKRGIAYSYIPLRQDGSIDSYEPKISTQDQQFLSIDKNMTEPQRLKIHESDRRLILLLETGNTQDPLLCYTGWVHENGLAPRDKSWDKVTMSFEKLNTDQDVQATYSSVITPQSYQ